MTLLWNMYLIEHLLHGCYITGLCRLQGTECLVACHCFCDSLSGWQKLETLSTNFRVFITFDIVMLLQAHWLLCHQRVKVLIFALNYCVKYSLLCAWSCFLRFLPRNFWYCMPDNLLKVPPPPSLSLCLVFCLCAGGGGRGGMGMHASVLLLLTLCGRVIFFSKFFTDH
jgi:hypothetical protein